MRAGDLRGAILGVLLLTTTFGLAAPATAAAEEVHVAWTATASARAAPQVVDDQVAVVVDHDRLRGLELATGRDAWEVRSGNASWRLTTVTGGLVVVGSDPSVPMDAHEDWTVNTTLVAFDALTGERRWTRELGGFLGHLAATAQGPVALWWSDEEAVLEALSPEGEPRWSVSVGPPGSAMAASKTIVVVEADGTMSAYGAATGELAWTTDTGDVLALHPDQDRVLVMTYHPDAQERVARTGLVALDPTDGRTVWTWEQTPAYATLGFHVAEGLVAVPGTDHRVHVLSLETGAAVASVEQTGDPWAIAFDGSLLYQVDPSGALSAWRVEDGSRVWNWRWNGAGVGLVTADDGAVLATLGTDGLVLLRPDGTGGGAAGVEVREVRAAPVAVAAGAPVAVAAVLEPGAPGLWEASIGLTVDGELEHAIDVAGEGLQGPLALPPVHPDTDGEHVIEIVLDGRPTGVRTTVVAGPSGEDPTVAATTPASTVTGGGPANWTATLSARATEAEPLGDRLLVGHETGLAALDGATGATVWSVDGAWYPSFEPAGDRVAVWDARTLRSLDADSGAERWTRTLAVDHLWTGRDWWYAVHDGHLSALDADTGATRWSTDLGVDAPIVAANGTLMVEVEGEDLVAVAAATGQTLWRVPSGEDFFQVRPTIVGDSVVVAANDTLQVLDLATGERRWARAEDLHHDARVAATDGRLFFTGAGGAVAAVTLGEGALAWTFDPEIGPVAGPTLSQAGLLIMGWNGHLRALDLTTGEPIWESDHNLISSPEALLVTEGTVLAVGGEPLRAGHEERVEGRRLAAVSLEDGRYQWALPLEGLGQDVVVAGDRVFYLGYHGGVHGLDTTRPPEPVVERVTVSPEAPSLADEVRVYVTVANHGGLAGVLSLSLSAPPAPPALDQWREVVVEPGENATVSFEPLWHLRPGAHNLTIGVLGAPDGGELVRTVTVRPWGEVEEGASAPATTAAILLASLAGAALGRRRR